MLLFNNKSQNEACLSPIYKFILKLLWEMIYDVSIKLKISNREIRTPSLPTHTKECARQVEII